MRHQHALPQVSVAVQARKRAASHRNSGLQGRQLGSENISGAYNRADGTASRYAARSVRNHLPAWGGRHGRRCIGRATRAWTAR